MPKGFTDTRPDPPAGLVQSVVEAGTGELGRVTLLFSSEVTLDPELRVDIALLELVVQQRLTDRIREELSASYSPFASVGLIEEPVDSVEFAISVSADPADLDAVASAALGEIEALRDDGPTEDELFIAQQQLLRDYELFSNEGLAAEILFYAEHPDEMLTEILTRGDRVLAAREAICGQPRSSCCRATATSTCGSFRSASSWKRPRRGLSRLRPPSTRG